MLARARKLTRDEAIEYQQGAIEDIRFPTDSFDVVISSLALHYVESFDVVCEKVANCLVPGGAFVLSVEHPIFTSVAAQDWYSSPEGERLHWPLDNYQQQGARHTQWLADDVVKYHRTLSNYMNTLLDCGFCISRVLEPQPTPEMLREQPWMKDDCRRPAFLLIAAVRL
jgi:SAM-dependent methyltransferase